MERSTERILTTHVGSLARPASLLDIMKEKENDRPYDHEAYAREVKAAVADRVRRQVECGIDIVADGEMSKVMFVDYVKDRLGGYEEDAEPKSQPASWKAEIDMFPEYYAEYMKLEASTVARRKTIVATGPITYIGQELLKIDIDNLKAAVDGLDVTEIFMPSNGPSGFGENRYYRAGRSTCKRLPRRCARSTSASSTPGSSCRSTIHGSSVRLRSQFADRGARASRHNMSRSSTTHCASLRTRFVITRATVEPRPVPDRHRPEGCNEVRAQDQRPLIRSRS